MKKSFISFAFVALAAAPVHSFAQEVFETGYLGANYVFLTYEEDGFSEEFDLGALVAKAGARFNPYLAAEVRAGFGVADDSISANGASLELELDYLIGGYILAGIPNETPVYPYIALGMSQGELTASIEAPGISASDSESESDVSYGVGANFKVNDELLINAEYMNYLDKDGAEISGVSLGASFLF